MQIDTTHNTHVDDLRGFWPPQQVVDQWEALNSGIWVTKACINTVYIGVCVPGS